MKFLNTLLLLLSPIYFSFAKNRMNDTFKTITSKEELKERLVSDTGHSINDVTDYVYNHLGSWEDLVQEVGIEKIDEDYYDTLVEDLGDYLRD